MKYSNGVRRKKNFGLALSNPKFEYWLLLHFEDGKGVTAGNCIEKLKKHVENYAKNKICISKFYEYTQTAIQHAKAKDASNCSDWPRTNGSTVYRLVEQMISASEKASAE